MTDKIHWNELFPQEFVQRRDACSVCYMPYGLAEPHGAFNALGLDWLKANALVERAARAHGGIVAPPFSWHAQELPEFHDNGQGQGWFLDVGVKQSLCSSIPFDLLLHNMLFHVRAFDARRFHAAILVTGHCGGIEIPMAKLAEYYLLRTGSPMRVAVIADPVTIDADLPHRGDHAGITETSQLMALCPGMVDLDRRSVPEELGTRFAGYVNFDKPPLPSVEIGQKIVESQVRNLGKLAAKLLAEYQPKPGYVPANLNQTEGIWHRFERVTRRYWTGSYPEYRQGGMFKFPEWKDLGEFAE